MNPTILVAAASAIYLGWSKLCDNVGCTEPIAWTLQKAADGTAYVGKMAVNAAVNVTKSASNKLHENMQKAKPEATAEDQPKDVIDVKATPTEE